MSLLTTKPVDLSRPERKELRRRARLVGDLIHQAYTWKLVGYPGHVVEDKTDGFGIQAFVVKSPIGRGLIVPGTGYREPGQPSEKRQDWRRNLRSAFAVPKLGAAGRYYWPMGWLELADWIDNWLGDQSLDFAGGHSQGAGGLQPLVWSRRDDKRRVIGEGHAFASPNGCFSRGVALDPHLHCWVLPFDPVTWVPPYAVNCGRTHKLPGPRFKHMMLSYLEGLDREEQREAGL